MIKKHSGPHASGATAIAWLGTVLVLVGHGLFAALPEGAPPRLISHDRERTVVRGKIYPEPRLTHRADGIAIAMPGYDVSGSPGEPLLPVDTLRIPIPEGLRPSHVRIRSAGSLTRQLNQDVIHAPTPFPLSHGPGKSVVRNPAVYGRSIPFPPRNPPVWKIERLHDKRILSIRLHPVQIVPANRSLIVHTSFDVEVEWAPRPLADRSERPKRRFPRSGDLDSLRATLDIPLENDPFLESGEAAPSDSESISRTTTLGEPSPLAPGDFAYLIVAPQAFFNVPGTNTFHTLLQHRRARGLTATNVPMEWITANYDGTRPDGGEDDATRLRNFVRDAYAQWGVRYLLLGGEPPFVPKRHFYQKVVLSSTYEAHIASDMYFGNLDGTFDGNADGRYGERNDGDDGGDVDLLAEVYVGRLLVRNTNEVARSVARILAYENQTAAAFGRVSFAGEHLGFGGVSEYAKPMMEQIRLGGDYDGYETTGFENSTYAGLFDTSRTLYDMDETWDKNDIAALFNQNTPLVLNHLGHGAYFIGLKLYSFQLSVLTNAPLPFFYSQACELARFDYSDCFGRKLTTGEGGVSAGIMNTHLGWGMQNSTDGPSHNFNRRFWHALFAENIHTLGHANQRSKEATRHRIRNLDSDVMRWCYYEINLFGDPATPFAPVLRTEAPVITHDPIPNQYHTNVPVLVTCEVTPSGFIDAASVEIIWSTSQDPGIVFTNALALSGADTYTFEMPPRPTGTDIAYSLRAATPAGVTSRHPQQPPAEHTFSITPPVSLVVSGTPANHGTPAPGYGNHTFASGIRVDTQAPLRTEPENGIRHASLGWSGTGSVPSSGTSNSCSFVIESDSSLTWIWDPEYALSCSSSVPGIVSATEWHSEGTLVSTPAAPSSAFLNDTSYRFAQWEIDGERVPVSSGTASNPVEEIVMSAPRNALARYLPEYLDTDGNSLADWWELYYFGALGNDAAADPDDDGFSNLEEYQAYRNPLDSEDIPSPPSIDHIPLADVIAYAPPYPINALLSDPRRIVNPSLMWSRNGGAWQTEPLAMTAPDLFTGIIPEPGHPGDDFLYMLSAANPAGYVAIDGPHAFSLVYPRAAVSPQPNQTLVVAPHRNAQGALTLVNHGNAILNWLLLPGRHQTLENDGGDFPSGWDPHVGDQSWVISATRSFSPTHAGFSHLVSESPPGPVSLHARLDMPPVIPAQHAKLSFRYWMNTEQDERRPGYVFDGGIIEVSTDDGQTFERLPGPYTHQITGWDKSPWPEGTPCLSDTGTGWKQAEFDLSNHAGDTVIVRFHHGGDNNTDYEGWYLDDITIGPLLESWPEHLSPARMQGELSPGQTNTISLTASADGLASPETILPLYCVSDDPVEPAQRSDAVLLLRHPPVLHSLDAGQSSTNGEGRVTIDASISDTDGDDCSLQFLFSTDAGLTWRVPALTAGEQLPSSTNLLADARLDDIPTRDPSGAPVTNSVSLSWWTRLDPAIEDVSPYTLLRAVPGDDEFEGSPVPSHPFMVDNQPPSPPVFLTAGPDTSTWATSRWIHASWSESDDGYGTGLDHYLLRLTNTLTGLCRSSTGIETSHILQAESDGDAWHLHLYAVDRVGNRSAPTSHGPLWIDSTPPSSSSAIVQVEHSDFGPYKVGTPVVIHWQGFTDSLSGLAGYHVSVQDDEAAWKSASPQSLDVPHLDATNRFSVRAQDHAGNIGDAVSTRCLILDPSGDWDGDGMSNADEEIAGTSAADSGSLLSITITIVNGNVFLIWPAGTNRYYTLEKSLSADPFSDWQPVPEAADLTGAGKDITVSVPFQNRSFFRVKASTTPSE